MGSYTQHAEQSTWTRGELNNGASSSGEGDCNASDADSVDSLTRDYMANCDTELDAGAQAAFAAPSRQPHVDELFAAADALAYGAHVRADALAYGACIRALTAGHAMAAAPATSHILALTAIRVRSVRRVAHGEGQA